MNSSYPCDIIASFNDKSHKEQCYENINVSKSHIISTMYVKFRHLQGK